MPPITYRDLIQPDDSIKKAIEEIKLLRASYTESIESIKLAATQLRTVLSSLGGKDITSLNQMMKQATELARNKKKLQDQEAAATREQQRLEQKQASEQLKMDKAQVAYAKEYYKYKKNMSDAELAEIKAQEKKLALLQRQASLEAQIAREKDRHTAAQTRNQAALDRQREKATKQQIADATRLERQQERLNEAKKRESLIWKLTHNNFTQSIALGNVLANVYSRIWQSFTAGLRKSWEVLTGFESTMSGMKAILMANESQFAKLQKQAVDLGGATIFTANEVGLLQIEYGKLGFSTQEIIDATEATLALAAAAGEGVQEAAAVGGAVLRGFGLQANEMGRVANVMTQGFVDSALDLEKFRESMKFISPVAEAAGFSIEGVTALLMKLADAGLYGSLAGTALRNIFLRLVDPTSDLAKAIGGPITSIEQFIPALKKLQQAGINLTNALELTDRRAVTAFATLLSKSDELNGTIVALENVGDAAQKMAEIRMDNVSGSIEKLSGAWEGLIIAIGTKENILTGVIRKWIDALTEFIDYIKNNIPELERFINAVKTATGALAGFVVGIKLVGPALTSLGKWIAGATSLTVGLANAWNKLVLIFKANWVGLLVAGLFAATSRINQMIKASREADDAMRALLSTEGMYKKAQDEAQVVMQKYNDELEIERRNARQLFSILKDDKAARNEKKIAMDEINARYKDLLPFMLTEKTNLEDIAAAQVIVNNELANNILLKTQKEEKDRIEQERMRALITAQEQLRNELGLTADEFNAIIQGGQYLPLGNLAPGEQTPESLIPGVQAAVTKLQGQYVRLNNLDLAIRNRIKNEDIVSAVFGSKKELAISTSTLFKTLDELRQEALIKIQEIDKVFEGQGVNGKEKGGGLPPLPKTESEKNKELKKYYEEYYDLLRARAEGIEDERERELELLRISYEKEMRMNDLEIKDVDIRNEMRIYKTAAYYRERLDLNEKYLKKQQDALDKEQKQEEKATKELEQELIDKIKLVEDAAIANVERREEEWKLTAVLTSTHNDINRKKLEEFELEKQRILLTSQIEQLKIRKAFNEADAKYYDDQIAAAQAKLSALGIKPKTKDIKSSLWSLLGFDMNDVDVKDFTSKVESAFKELSSVITDVTDTWVEEANRRVEASRSEVDQLQRTLQIEMEAKRDGLANDYDLIQRRLRIAEEEQAKNIALQEKAYEQQKALETAMQVSSLITASADIIQSAAEISGVAAPIVAGVALTAMWGAFAAAQIKANSATKNLAEGEVDIDGPGTETSDSIPARLSRGESVITAKATRKYKGALQAMLHEDDGAVLREMMVIMSARNHGDMAREAVQRDIVLKHDLERVFGRFLDKMDRVKEENGYRIERVGNVITRIKK